MIFTDEKIHSYIENKELNVKSIDCVDMYLGIDLTLTITCIEWYCVTAEAVQRRPWNPYQQCFHGLPDINLAASSWIEIDIMWTLHHDLVYDVRWTDQKNMATVTVDRAGARVPRDLRYRRQIFPEGDDLVFDVKEKGFVPVPIILRKLLRHLSAPEVRVLLYLHLRASRYGICYPTTEEIVHELGLTSKKNLLPHLKSLDEKRFISVRETTTKTFYLIHNPRVAVKHLIDAGELKEEEIFEINDLYADLNQESVAVVLPKVRPE